MVELCLMTSSTYSYGLFHQEQSLCRGYKEFQTFLPSVGMRKEIVRSGSLHLRPPKLEDPWKSAGWMLESNQPLKLDSTIKSPVLIDVQETRPDTVLFSFGIAERCTGHQNILKFLMAGSSDGGREGIDLHLLSDLLGIHTSKIHMHPQTIPPEDKLCLYVDGSDESQRSLFYPWGELYSNAPFLDFTMDLASGSKVTVQPDARVLFSGTRPEMKDLLSIVAEFYPSNNSAKWRNQSLLIPEFTRTEISEARANIQGTSLKLETATIAPLKSPKKIKLKPPTKKRNSRKAGKERDLYRKNYFHACESLLSLIFDKRQGKTAILSLKNTDPEIPQLLTQFSAGIAGTGLAVLFSVICKVTGGRVPFCASKLLNTGFGFGLVWLSWAVNKLRDSIVYISENTSKLGVKDKDMLRRVDRSVNEIFFRAATLMVFAMLRYV